MKKLNCTYIALFVTLFLTWGAAQVSAQQESPLTNYMFNRMAINPAYAGVHGNWAVTGLYRHQWAGFEGAPMLINLNAHTGFGQSRHGAGINLVNDRLGDFRNTAANANYAFRIPIALSNNNYGYFSMGVMGGIVQSAFDAPANLTQNNDPAIPNTNTSTLRPDVGAGLMFHTHNWYVGVSSIHLVEFDYEYTNASKASMARHYFFTAGMDIPTSKLNKNFIISPSVFVRYTANADVQFDLNTNFMFLQRFWVGALYRHEDAVGILAGFLPTESFRIGYSYDISISNISGYNNGSHEIMLSYQFGKIKSGIVSPRFF